MIFQIYVPNVMKSGSVKLLEAFGPHRACYGNALTILLLRCESTKEAIKQCGNRICDLWKESRLTLQTTAGEGNVNVTGFLLHNLEEIEHIHFG